MVNPSHISFIVNERSYLARLKREIHALAVQAGFDQKKLNEVDIVVSELGSNLVKHAKSGELLAGVVNIGHVKALELIALDQGPGIPDPDRMLLDGVSTTQTLGHGLGSIRRLSDSFELYTQKDWGTIVLCRINLTDKPATSGRRSGLNLRSLVIAKPGETFSGDGCFSLVAKDGTIRLLVADGLGHGPEASSAVEAAIDALKTSGIESPAETIRHIHAAIKRTRGVVATIIVLDPVEKTWTICGVGNISIRFSGSNQAKGYLSYNGIVGHNIPNSLNDQVVALQEYQQIVLCSDGIKSRWEHAKFPGIQKYELIIQAAALYKDFARKTDDMSIIIGRVES
jgi:anti-sigma regulatory factor (Ser/Thr protein kinase)